MRNRKAIVAAGLTAGVLDILWAAGVTLVKGRSPVQMLQGIASGLLGQDAFEGGAAAAALGLLCHFTVAMGAATVFYAFSRMVPWLVRQPFLGGPLFGLGVYFFMYLGVIPISAAPWHPSFAPTAVALALCAHFFCVGIPIALVIRRLAPA